MLPPSLSRLGHVPCSAIPSRRARRARLHLVALLFISLLVLAAPGIAEAKPKTHTVYSGQRLGSIAKRYNVTVDELCRANGITRNSTIRPGQKLIIPGTDDGEGDDKSKAKSKSKSDSKEEKSPSRPQGKTRVHVVAKGHTLSAIAGRYAITVSSLCNANGIGRNASLSVGQKLIIPHKTDKGGDYAREQRLRGDFDEQTKAEPDEDDEKEDKKSKSDATSKKSWQPYVKPAWRRGFIKIRRYGRYWEGYVIGPKNEVLGHASNKINFVLGAQSDGPRIDSKLIRLIASVSDKFGGREMRIVSGYRTKSFVAASKHKQGKALDFSIPGIPNEIMRDYLRSLDDVGVGYYPNSSFVHLDVRGYNSYWIDHAGPGEAPRVVRKSKKTRGSSGKKNSGRQEESKEDDEIDEHEQDHDDTNEGSGAPESKTDDSGAPESKTDDSDAPESKTDDSDAPESKTGDSDTTQSKSKDSSGTKKAKTDDEPTKKTQSTSSKSAE